MTNINLNTNLYQKENQQKFSQLVQETNGNYVINKPITAEDFVYCAKCVISKKYKRLGSVHNPKDSKDYFITALALYENEVLAAIFLDNKHRIMSFEILSSGTINQTAFYPREIVKQILDRNSAAIILAHNHPSGELTPSKEDIKFTWELKSFLQKLKIGLLDHILVGGGDAISFADQGWL